MKHEQIKHDINKDGYHVIPDFISNEQVDEMRKLCDELPPHRGIVHGWTPSQAMFAKDGLPWLYYYTPHIHDNKTINYIKEKLCPICTELLGPCTFRATDFIVNCARSHRQKELIYRPHVDTPYRFEKFKDRTDLIGMQIAVVIDELTEENVATGYIPGSHTLKYELMDHGKNTNHEKYVNFFLSNCKQHIAKPGTLILWDGRLLHSTMPNKTNTNRRLFLINAVSKSVCDELDILDPIN